MTQQTDAYVSKVRDFLAAHRDFEVERTRRALVEAATEGDELTRRMYEDRLNRLREIQIV